RISATPLGRTVRPHAPSLDRAVDPWVYRVVAGWPRDPRLHILEQKHGLPQRRALAAEDAAHGRKDGPHARARAGLRDRDLWFSLGPAFERQSRLRRIPHRDAAAS